MWYGCIQLYKERSRHMLCGMDVYSFIKNALGICYVVWMYTAL